MKNQKRLLLILLLAVALAGFGLPTNAATSRQFHFEQNNAATGNCPQGHSFCFNSTSPVPLITVNQGDSITITVHNNDTVTTHTFTFTTAPYTSVDTGNMTPGQNKTLTFTANTAGLFNYVCNFHPTDMKGTLKVNAVSSAPISPIVVLGLLMSTVSAAYIVTRRRR